MKLGLGRISAVWLLALSYGGLGCGGPSRHETLVKQGLAAEKQEQWVQAAAIYQKACTLKPNAAATCLRAQEMRDYAVDLRTYQARKLCDAGQLQECLAQLAPVRELQSKNQPKVLEVINLAAALSTKQCFADDQARRALTPALAELRCLMGSREPLWASEAFRTHYGLRSRDIASLLLQRANNATQDADGSRLSFLQAAECLAPLTPQELQQVQVAQGHFLSRSQTHLDLQYTANGTTRPARGTCMEIAAKIGRGLHCESGSAPPQAPLRIAAEVFSLQPRWKRTHRDRRQVARYKAGTETLENPDYERAKIEYELADGRFREAERLARDREARCQDTKSESDCEAFESAQETSEDRQRELDDARHRFHKEPASITRDVFKDHAYVIRSHRWAAPFRASIRVGTATPAAEITEIVYTDSEQPGSSEAGIRADAFEAPAENYFRDESSRWLSARIESQLIDELGRRARQEVERCSGDSVDCWATASFWLGITNFGLPLLEQISIDEQLPALQCTASLL